MTKLFITVILWIGPTLLLLSFAAPLRAHQVGAPTGGSSQRNDTTKISRQQTVQIILLTQRSYCFPDLATRITPLTVRQKFTLFVNNSISGHTLVGSAANAGLSQAFNWQAGYGQGAEGYGKRFGAYMARNASSNFFGTFLFASTFRQDPRFFVRSSPTFGRAVKYSLKRIVITRHDSGENTVNFSGLLGPLASEGLANAYLPAQDRTFGNTMARYGADIGWLAVGNILREYWPTLSKHLVRTKHPPKN